MTLNLEFLKSIKIHDTKTKPCTCGGIASSREVVKITREVLRKGYYDKACVLAKSIALDLSEGRLEEADLKVMRLNRIMGSIGTKPIQS